MAELTAHSIKHHPWEGAPTITSWAKEGPSRRMSYTPRTQARPKRLRNSECRELLVSSNTSLPGIRVHGSACRCSEIQTENQIEDALLAQKIASLSKSLLPTTPSTTTMTTTTATITTKALPHHHLARHRSSRPGLAGHGILSTLTRLFSPPPRPTPPGSLAFQADLCIGAADLDIDKLARYLVLATPPVVNVNRPNHLDLTPLMAAVQSPAAAVRPRAHLEMVRFLVEVCGADAEACRVDRVTGLEESVLSMACAAGRVAVVRFLVRRGVKVDGRLLDGAGVGKGGVSGRRGRTALHVAAEAGRGGCIEVLVKDGGADVNVVLEADGVQGRDAPRTGFRGSRGRTNNVSWEGKGKRGRNPISALHLAHRSQVCTRVLLESGAKVNAKDGYGRTPLHWAAEAGESDVVQLLVAAGADLNAAAEDGVTPLAALVEFLDNDGEGHGRVELAKLLLQGGVGSAIGTSREKSVAERVDC